MNVTVMPLVNLVRFIGRIIIIGTCRSQTLEKITNNSSCNSSLVVVVVVAVAVVVVVVAAAAAVVVVLVAVVVVNCVHQFYV